MSTLQAALYVVATPIGNLGDLTPRARETLEAVGAILCEDTRRTSTLLSALGISGKRLERFDHHSTEARAKELIERIQGGEALALVTDAGTPSVSDPGSRLVRVAREAGVRVVPLPGASAVATLISVTGFEATAFTFRGFFPRKTKEREQELERAAHAARSDFSTTVMYFESPERVVDALAEIARFAPRLRVCAAKELTKIHEKTFVGSAADAAEAVAREIESEGARGEWCFVLDFTEATKSDAGDGFPTDPRGDKKISLQWVTALQCMLGAQVSASVAAKQVCQHFGVPRNEAYEMALRLSGKKN